MTGKSFGKQMCSLTGLLMLLVVATGMAGCSSSMTRVQTWEGKPMDASGVAVLEAPGEIQVAEVNGRSVTNFLMDDLALDYELLPGNNRIVFSYKTIWAKSTVVKNGESKVATVTSEPQVVDLVARAGETYRFRFDKPASRAEAEAMMADFSASIVSASGAVVATSSVYTGPERSDELLAGPASGTATSAAAGDVDTLETMKLLWQRATADEKREFLRWAFE